MRSSNALSASAARDNRRFDSPHRRARTATAGPRRSRRRDAASADGIVAGRVGLRGGAERACPSPAARSFAEGTSQKSSSDCGNGRVLRGLKRLRSDRFLAWRRLGLRRWADWESWSTGAWPDSGQVQSPIATATTSDARATSGALRVAEQRRVAVGQRLHQLLLEILTARAGELRYALFVETARAIDLGTQPRRADRAVHVRCERPPRCTT